MADQEPRDHSSEDVEYKGGWQQPEKPGVWRQVETEAEIAQTGGWRVPAMPTDMDESPTREGDWHLPRPEDTRFAPEDEIEITQASQALRPEDMALPTDSAVETEDEVEEIIEEEEAEPDLETFSGLGDLMVQLMDAQADTAEDGAEQETMEAGDLDFTSTQSPEYEALQRAAHEEATGDEATELHPADYARQQIDALGQDAPTETSAEATVTSPEDYAKQQLAALQGDAVDTAEEAPAEAASPTDPAEIARQQIAQLSGEAAAEAPSAEDELAAKFRDTEQQVQALRIQYQNGQITRDQLQTRLREYLILDNNDQWWMMGVDTNNWYRYDNAANDWVADTPPVSYAAPGGPATITSEFTPDEVLHGSLPYLPDDDDSAAATSFTEMTPTPSDTQAFDTDMPLPQQVPTFDPDMTMVGRSAIDQNTTRFSDAETLDSSQYEGSAPTIRATPVDVDAYPEPAPVYDAEVDDDSRIYEQALERQRQSNFRRLALLATLLVGGLFLVGTAAVLIGVVTYNNRATLYRDQIDALASFSPPFQSVQIYDSGSDLIAEISSDEGGARTTVDLEDVSPQGIYAIVGSEDPAYFSRPGFDLPTVALAFLQGGRSGDATDIARQVARTVIAANEDEVSPNALDEIVVASEITRQYGRNFILELYLNNASFGNQAFGVEAASQFYFETSAANLNLTQGAMLAALLEDQVGHDPVPKENRQIAFEATDAVLRELATVGCLRFNHPEVSNGQYCVAESSIMRNAQDFTSQIVVERAELQTLDFFPRSATGDHPHFVDYVRRQLIAEYGDQIFRDGFKVYTTLNPSVQATAERSLREQLAQQAFTGLQTGAVMAVDPATGAVMAMVGSPDFNNLEIDGQTNNTLTWQLPGATMLPLLYSAALSGQDLNGNGVLDYNEYLTPATTLFDLPPDYQDPRFPVNNGDSQFRGAISLRQALANNLKPPAIRTYQFVGAERYVEVASNMGLRFSNNPPIVDLGTAVGATTDARLYDLMQAYSVLASTGQYIPLQTIRRITTSDNQEVPLTANLTANTAGALTPSIAFLVQNIMSEQSTFEGQFAPLFMPEYPNRMAVKINYLNDNRDMWAVGFSRSAVVGVWMGRPDDRATIANSREAALPVWQQVMLSALQGQNPAPFNQVPANVASNIVNARVCSATGASATGSNCAPQRNEFVDINHPPPDPNTSGYPTVAVAVDAWTRLIANEFCQENVLQQQFTRLLPPDPGAIQWLNTNSGRPTANRMGLPSPVQNPPTQACQANTEIPVAAISSPPDNGAPISGTVQILGVASAPNFGSYTLDYAPAGTQNFQRIAGPVNAPRDTQNSVLADWNTTTVPNGQYTLRLMMNSANNAGFIQRLITITVQNIPTPTPTIMPSATTPPILATDTTIPLFPTDTPISGGGQIIGEATATPTITLGG